MPNFDRLIRKAKQTNAQRDEMDRKMARKNPQGSSIPGVLLGAPGDLSPYVHLGTAIEAIKAGISMNNWDCVAEGYLMLVDLQPRLRTEQDHV